MIPIMLNWPEINYDPELESEWASKGSENDEHANYIVLKEKRKSVGFDGSLEIEYRYEIPNQPGKSYWISLYQLNILFAPWNDPWSAQKKLAKQWGFTFKHKIEEK